MSYIEGKSNDSIFDAVILPILFLCIELYTLKFLWDKSKQKINLMCNIVHQPSYSMLSYVQIRVCQVELGILLFYDLFCILEFALWAHYRDFTAMLPLLDALIVEGSLFLSTSALQTVITLQLFEWIA